MTKIPESLLAGCILVLFINLGDRGDTFHRDVGEFLLDCAVLPLWELTSLSLQWLFLLFLWLPIVTIIIIDYCCDRISVVAVVSLSAYNFALLHINTRITDLQEIKHDIGRVAVQPSCDLYRFVVLWICCYNYRYLIPYNWIIILK
jgi:hypothetical protein